MYALPKLLVPQLPASDSSVFNFTQHNCKIAFMTHWAPYQGELNTVTTKIQKKSGDHDMKTTVEGTRAS